MNDLKNGNVDRVIELIRSGGDLEQGLLYTAVECNLPEVVKELLAVGVQPDVKYNGRSPLELACQYRRWKILKLLEHDTTPFQFSESQLKELWSDYLEEANIHDYVEHLAEGNDYIPEPQEVDEIQELWVSFIESMFVDYQIDLRGQNWDRFDIL